MNIFITDTDPVKSATDLPDKLLVKMVLETAQILCTAHRELDGDQYADRHNLYKAAYTHHPAVKWVQTDFKAYWWTYALFVHLTYEYFLRYEKQHACADLTKPLQEIPKNIPRSNTTMYHLFTTAPLCMPDEYKTEYSYYYHDDMKYDLEKSYRRYLALGKEYIQDATAWSKGRSAPDWFYTIRGVKNFYANQPEEKYDWE